MSELDAFVCADDSVGTAILRVPPGTQDISCGDCDGSFRWHCKKCTDSLCDYRRRANAIYQWKARVFQTFVRGVSVSTAFVVGLTTVPGTSDSVSFGWTRGQLGGDYSAQQSMSASTDRPGHSIRLAIDDWCLSAHTWISRPSARLCIGVVFSRKIHLWISLNIHHLQTVFLYQRHFCSITIIDLVHTLSQYLLLLFLKAWAEFDMETRAAGY